MAKRASAASNNLLRFLLRGLIIVIFVAILVALFAEYGFYIGGGIVVGYYLFARYWRVRSLKRELEDFLRDRYKRRNISMDVGRWGDFIYVNIFGIYFAAYYKSKEDMKHMVADVVYTCKDISDEGKLPKGKLYSEVTADLVRTLGVDNDWIEWKCKTEVYSDIQYLLKLGFSREPKLMNDWIKVLQIVEKESGRTVYHQSFLQRVINEVEEKAANVQSESIRAGGNVARQEG